ncbi:MAG: SAM-dependent methyltransferase [Archangium sp.]
MSDEVEKVRAYYDHNTASFLETGQGGTSIRRAIWEPGVTERDDAFRTVDRRLLNEISEGARVVDLGCGVGSSLLWLAERKTFDGIGITLSGVQAKFFDEEIGRRDWRDRLRCVAGSFVTPPPEVNDVDVAFAIEAFVHAPSAAAFFGGIAPRMKANARLIILDDFLERAPKDARDERTLLDVREGWLANTLATPSELEDIARGHGLELKANEDWSSWLELGRPRDRLLAVVAAIGRPFRAQSWLLRSWVGGVALQRGLREKLISHRLLTFRKTQP